MVVAGAPSCASTRPTTSDFASLATGSAAPPAEAPAGGGRFEQVLVHRDLVVEQILSGANHERADFEQDDDEWVVVLAGGAVLEVGGERLDLAPGDWVFLPSGVADSVIRTDAGTSWLAVHLRP